MRMFSRGSRLIGPAAPDATRDYRNRLRYDSRMIRRMSIEERGSATTGRVTIRDIARLAGVSVATVSRVLNDRPDVSPETRDAVLRHIREHNFTSNRSARALSSGRTGLIGLSVPMVQGDYFAA